MNRFFAHISSRLYSKLKRKQSLKIDNIIPRRNFNDQMPDECRHKHHHKWNILPEYLLYFFFHSFVPRCTSRSQLRSALLFPVSSVQDYPLHLLHIRAFPQIKLRQVLQVLSSQVPLLFCRPSLPVCAIHQSLTGRAQCGRLSCNIPNGMKYMIKKMKQKLLVV